MRRLLLRLLRRWLWLPWPTKSWLMESPTASTYPGHEPDVVDLEQERIWRFLA